MDILVSNTSGLHHWYQSLRALVSFYVTDDFSVCVRSCLIISYPFASLERACGVCFLLAHYGEWCLPGHRFSLREWRVNEIDSVGLALINLVFK